MSPLNAAICTTTYLERQKCYGPGKKILFKKQLFDLEVKGQGPTKFITVRDTLPYSHAPTYQISLTYLERQKCYGPDKKILFKKQLFDLQVKGQGPTKVITARDTPPYGHAPTYQISLTYLERQTSYGPYKLRWEEAEEEEEEAEEEEEEAEEKNQTNNIYVSLHLKGRHNYISSFCCPFSFFVIEWKSNNIS